jgi:hypothetical protein
MDRILFVHHHLGMGDHIMCNGLVRSLLNDGKVYTGVYVFAKDKNASRVSRMFDDDPRIQVVPIPSSENEISYVNAVISKYGIVDFVRCGFGAIDNLMSMGLISNFDEAFYIGAGIPFDAKWSQFKIRRDYKEEQRVLNKLNPSEKPFMFVHDDPSRGFVLNPPNPHGLQIIKNDVTVDLFDMIGVLEAASEIHCMESSISNLIEFLPNVVCPLYMHRGIRVDENGKSQNATSRMKRWTIV